MIDVNEITIDEFKDTIYSNYLKLFPIDEQRSLKKIEDTYESGIEKIYKITHNNITIGFFMLERINNSYPYYLDYFAIFEDYQNKGFGTEALKVLINKIVKDCELIGEIEKVSDDNPKSIKRFDFYKKLGFRKTSREYLLYNVYYNPIIYSKSKDFDSNKYDKTFFDYYKINCGEEEVKKKCRIIV